MNKTLTFTVATTKTRNPIAVAARFRQAGSHRRSESGMRQMAHRNLRRELADLKHSP